MTSTASIPLSLLLLDSVKLLTAEELPEDLYAIAALLDISSWSNSSYRLLVDEIGYLMQVNIDTFPRDELIISLPHASHFAFAFTSNTLSDK